MKSLADITNEIKEKSNTELVELYNEAAMAKITKFRDRASAITRTAKALFDAENPQSGETQEGAPAPAKVSKKAQAKADKASKKAEKEAAAAAKKAEKEAAAAAKKAEKEAAAAAKVEAKAKAKAEREAARAAKKAEREARKGQPRIIKYDMPASKVIKPHREGTIRDRLIKVLLSGGSKYEELGAKTKTNQERGFRKDLIMLNHDLGYGLRSDEDGTIHAFVSK